MKTASKVFAGLFIFVGFLPSLLNAAPSRELKIDSILLETIDLTRGVKGTQTARLLKVCVDGQAYFLFASKPPSVALQSFAPAFKDGKPETCSK
jgi:hypothetical protein